MLTQKSVERGRNFDMDEKMNSKILRELNPAQLEAVETTDGPLLILAGAGSGKTKTLTHRIAYIISQNLALPSEILAVTFTNKAAGEMRERLAQLLGQENSRNFMPWMGTFHSIAVRLLKIYGENIEVPKNFVILDESDRQSIVKSAMKELGITDKQYSPRSISSQISNAKNQLLTPADFAKNARAPQQKVVAEVFARYETLRKNAKSLDFDDLLNETVRLLSKVEDVREKLRAKFKFSMIDEYQDTNAAQYKMIKLLANANNNVCAVGDDWQSIYSWRGADFMNILNFERDFPGAKIIKLEQNYRSTQNILNAAANVISRNENRSEKNLFTKLGEGKQVEILATRDEQNEAQKIANLINSEVAVGSRNFRDFAILYRTNAQSRVLEENFLRASLPYKIVGGTRFYDRAEVKDLLAYLKFVYQPFDRASFQRIFNTPKRGLGETSFSKFERFWSARGDSILDSLNDILSQESDAFFATNPAFKLQKSAREKLAKFGAELDFFAKKIETTAPAEILDEMIRKFDFANYLNDGTPQSESRIENIQELVGVAGQFGAVPDFLEEVSLISSADTENRENSATMMTLHAAKGLEFPVVFMVGMEEGLFPGQKAEMEASAMEEERRLCYVGMTRAREELYLTFARSRFLFGQRTYNMPSQFLSDAVPEFSRFGDDNYANEDDADFYGDLEFSEDNFAKYQHYGAMNFHKKYGPEKAASAENFAKNNESRVVYEDDSYGNSLAVGDKVKHQIFGIGEIREIDGSLVKVDFGGKSRNLNVEFAPLEKL